MEDASMEELRRFLKSGRWDEWEAYETDQRKRIPAPPPQKPCPPDAALIDLVLPGDLKVGDMPLLQAINRRRSRRQFSGQPLTLEELSFLLWATQGVREAVPGGLLRTVPSAGARHPFETYLAVNRVAGLAPGLYRYLGTEHKLCFLRAEEGLPGKLTECSRKQAFVGRSAVTFIWTAIPYRTEWRYAFISHRVIAMDAGHLCQNLYLACEAIGAGTCAVGAYDQEKMDAFLGIDGREEFTVYLAPVGKV